MELFESLLYSLSIKSLNSRERLISFIINTKRIDPSVVTLLNPVQKGKSTSFFYKESQIKLQKLTEIKRCSLNLQCNWTCSLSESQGSHNKMKGHDFIYRICLVKVSVVTGGNSQRTIYTSPRDKSSGLENSTSSGICSSSFSYFIGFPFLWGSLHRRNCFYKTYKFIIVQ